MPRDVWARIKAAYDRRLQQHVDKIAELEPAVQQLGRQDSEQQRAVAAEELVVEGVDEFLVGPSSGFMD